MSVYDAALEAYLDIAASDTKRSPKADADYVRAVVDATLAYREPLFSMPPHRFQLSRRRGWRIPEGGVSCARPHRYGNPFIVATPKNGGNISREQAVAMFRSALLDGRLQFSVNEVRRELRSRPLGCWCSLNDACHVDVLLEVANS